MINFFFIVLCISIIQKLFSTESNFIQSGSCVSNCNGSKEYPFTSLHQALTATLVPENAGKEVHIQFLDEKIEIDDMIQNFTTPVYLISNINLSLNSGSPSRSTEIFFKQGAIFYFEVISGSLIFENIKISTIPWEKPISFKPNDIDTRVLGQGFIKVKCLAKVFLKINSSHFSQTFIKIDENSSAQVFLALIYLHQDDNKCESITLNIENSSFTKTKYPRGILFTDSLGYQKDVQKISIYTKNIILKGISNEYFLHWYNKNFMDKENYGYFDFCFIVNNTNFIMEDIQIVQTSRFFLGIKNNNISIANLDFSNSEQIQYPPELIYILESNSLLGLNLTFHDFIASSFDDTDPVELRDAPVLLSNLLPSTLMNFEKNQAIIKFGTRNNVKLVQLTVRNSTLLKKENLILAFLHSEDSNIIFIAELNLENCTMETNSRIGTISYFVLSNQNKLSLSNCNISQISGYAYSSAFFIYAFVGNLISIKKITTKIAFFKTKLDRNSLYLFNMIFASNYKKILFTPMENLYGGGLTFLYFQNYLELIDSIFIDVLSLYGGVSSLFFMNNILVNRSHVSTIRSESLGSFLSLAISNNMTVLFVNLNNSRSIGGSIFCYANSTGYVEQFIVYNSWGSGGYDFFAYRVSGCIGVYKFNNLIVKSSTFQKGNSDTDGGGINIGIYNIISITRCKFSENESTNNDSRGGAIFIENGNAVNITYCTFFLNYARGGGVIGAEEFNNIFMGDCQIFQNKGDLGGVFFFTFSNNFSLVQTEISNNQALYQGGSLLNAEDSNNSIILMRCSFYENQVPLYSYLFNISARNFIEVQTLSISQKESGIGNIFFFNQKNIIFMRDLIVSSTLMMDYFIFSNYSNFLIIENLLFMDNQLTANLLLLNISNSLVVINIFINSSLLNSLNSGIFSFQLNNKILIEGINISYSDTRHYLLLYANQSNKVEIKRGFFLANKLQSNASLAASNNSNILHISEILIYDIVGIENKIFMIHLFNRTLLFFFNMKIFGRINHQSSLETSCDFFQTSGTGNHIVILNLQAEIAFSNYDQKRMNSFLNLTGTGNTFLLSQSRIAFKNMFFIISVDGGNTAFLISRNFINGSNLGKLITVKDGAKFFSSHTKFLSTSKSIIDNYLINVYNFSRVLFIENSFAFAANLLLSTNSKVSIKLSTFSSCMMKPNTSLYFLSIMNNSLLKISQSYIFCISNLIDSPTIVENSVIEVNYSFIAFNKGIMGGFLVSKGRSIMRFISNKFYLNKANLGGVIYILRMDSINISSNFFFQNSAEQCRGAQKSLNPGKGGIFFLASEVDDNVTITINRNKFYENGAQIGGIIYLSGDKLGNITELWNSFKFEANNNIRRTKVGFFGQIIATKSSKIGLIPKSDFSFFINSKIFLNISLSPNQNNVECLAKVISLDSFDAISIGSQELLTPKFNNSDFNLSFVSAIDTFPCLNSLKPLSLSFLLDHSKQPKVLALNSKIFLNNNKSDASLNLNVSLFYQSCQIGEYFDLKTLSCVECEPNFFSFRENYLEPSSCKSCAEEPFYCYGGFRLSAKEKFWRSNYQSTVFLSCPSELACIGDPNLDLISYQKTILYLDYNISYPQGLCRYGYQGALCNKCIKGFSKINNICLSCSGVVNILFMILKSVFMIFFNFFVVSKALLLCKSLKKNKVIIGLVHSNFLIKIMMLHLQYLKIFVKFPFTIPSTIKDIVSVILFSFSTSIDEAASLDCLIDLKKVNMMYLSNIFIVSKPLFLMICIMFFSRILNILKKREIKKAKHIRNEIIDFFYMLVLTTMLNYDHIMTKLMENFSFLNISQESLPEYRLLQDFEIDYFSYSHQTWNKIFSIPLSIAFGLIVPGFIFWSIYKYLKVERLYTKRALFRFGYFYFAYDRNHIYYEVSYMIRKLLLISIDVFFLRKIKLNATVSPVFFLLLMCFLYSLFALISNKKNPYVDKKYNILNKVEKMYLTFQATLCWLGCFILTLKLQDQGIVYEIFDFIGFLFFMAANLFLFCSWGFYYWRVSAKSQVQYYLQKIKNITLSKKKTALKKKTTFKFRSFSILSNNIENQRKLTKTNSHRLINKQTKNLKTDKFHIDDEINRTIYYQMLAYKNKLVELGHSEFVDNVEKQVEASVAEKWEENFVITEQEGIVQKIKQSKNLGKYKNLSANKDIIQNIDNKLVILEVKPVKVESKSEKEFTNILSTLINRKDAENKEGAVDIYPSSFEIINFQKQLKITKPKSNTHLEIKLDLKSKNDLLAFSNSDRISIGVQNKNFYFSVADQKYEQGLLGFAIHVRYKDINYISASETISITINTTSDIIDISLEIFFEDFLSCSTCSKQNFETEETYLKYFLPQENLSLDLFRSSSSHNDSEASRSRLFVGLKRVYLSGNERYPLEDFFSHKKWQL